MAVCDDEVIECCNIARKIKAFVAGLSFLSYKMCRNSCYGNLSKFQFEFGNFNIPATIYKQNRNTETVK